MRYLLIGFVKAWRAVISPLYGDVCKFYPSCSAYGLEALQLHGAVKGSWLIMSRLFRCHPWSVGGVDPVPGSPFAQRLAASKDAGNKPSSQNFSGHKSQTQDHEGICSQHSCDGHQAVI